MENTLTKDSMRLLCVMYKSYLEKRKSGMSKSSSNEFGSSHAIHETLLPDWQFDDVNETCFELARAGFIVIDYGDNIVTQASITDSGISFMENRFKNGLAGVVDFLTKFIPNIPTLM